MATIVTRTGKGSALTFTEADDNFVNLNNDGIANSTAITNLQNDKLDKAGGTVTGTLNVNGNLTLGSKVIGSSGNNSQSGTAVTLSGISTEIVRLTNSSLVSIAGASGATSGQKLVLVNQTGVNVTILNDSVSAPAGEKIFTGNGSDVLLQQNASISFVYDNSSSRWQLIGGTGSGGGSSGINYIVNSDASTGTTGYTTYNDSAAAPVDGSGGTPAAGLWVRSTTTPLRGSGDFNLVKTGSTSYQGNGVAYDFTIDNADLARVLTVSFDYGVVSGTYATGDLTVYLIQDPTGTPVVIQPAGYQVVAATAGTKMTQIATFQTDSSQKSYRLCFHVATTSALDYTLALDNIVVGPTQKVYGAPVTDWQSYTPTITTASGTMTNYTALGRYRRVGDQLEFTGEIEFTGAVGTWSGVQASIPSGLSIDTSKLPSASAEQSLGISSAVDTGVFDYSLGKVRYRDATTISIFYSSTKTDDAGSPTDPLLGIAFTQNFPFSFGTGDKIFWRGAAPIIGWSSNVEVSSSTDTRVVAASYAISTANTPGANFSARTVVKYATKVADTHSAYDTSTGQYTVPVSGQYRITAQASFSHTEIVGNTYAIIIQTGLTGSAGTLQAEGLNIGVVAATRRQTLTASTILSLNAGDTINIAAYDTNTSPSIFNAPSEGRLSIERLSGPSQIAASETVAMRAYKTTGTHTNSPAGWQIVASYNASPYDTHGAFNVTTGEYTVPVSGTYQVSACIGFLSNSTGVRGVRIDLDGSVAAGGNFIAPVTTGLETLSVAAGIVKANAGQKISLQGYQTSGGNLGYTATANFNHFSVVRVGN